MNATEEIFNAIKKQLDEGTVPWHKPWVSNPSAIINHYNGKPYTGLRNRMLLGCAGEYATVHQINEEGGRVKKGSKGHRVYFSKSYTKTKDNGEDQKVYVLRAFTVFHIDDTTLEPKYRDVWGAPPPKDCDAKSVIEDYAARAGIGLRWGGDSAHYSPGHDYIIVPAESDFKNNAEFWGAVFHELGHSTMQALKRKYSYAKEELVAEICACLCLGKLGLTPTIENSSAYIASWKKSIADFKATDFSDACRSAEQAFRFIFNIKDNSNEQQ